MPGASWLGSAQSLPPWASMMVLQMGTLTELWNALGFDCLRKVFRHTRHSIDVEALIRVMVFNRLCDPDSKLGVLRWLQTVALPGTSLQAIDHRHLLSAMDALIDHKAEVDNVMAALLRPLVCYVRRNPGFTAP